MLKQPFIIFFFFFCDRVEHHIRERTARKMRIVPTRTVSSTVSADLMSETVKALPSEAVELLASFVRKHASPHHPCVALVGAGCSTESGIPDYRSAGGLYSVPGYTPIMHHEFINFEKMRKRYWARSIFGYASLQRKKWNVAHKSLARLCCSAYGGELITQNVDGLHHAASEAVVSECSGSTCRTPAIDKIIELHGSLHRAVCLGCRTAFSRTCANQMFLDVNPMIADAVRDRQNEARVRPDGDFELSEELLDRVQLFNCPHCGGVIKPDVVFFGGSIAPEIQQRALAAVASAGCLLCCGTSLQVYSAYSLAKSARLLGIPIAIVNLGPTRADGMEQLRIDDWKLGDLLPKAVDRLLS